MNGVWFEFEDKHVDEILLENGYSDNLIFYSPIKSWFMFWIFLSGMTFPLVLVVLYFIYPFLLSTKGLIFIFGYVGITYLIICLFNRSFAISNDEFIIINSHFLFKTFQVVKLSEIRKVKISSDWKMKFLWIFGLVGSNYVQIKTMVEEKKYYCLFLDVDCFDENWTEKTLDDLERNLKFKGIQVEFDFDLKK